MAQTLTRPQATDGSDAGVLTNEALAAFSGDFAANPVYRMAQNAVTQITVDDVALNRAIVTNTDHTFSTLLDDWGVTNQKQTGRCWMFAGPQSAARRRDEEDGRQGVRVQPELPDVLGQAGARQLLLRGDHRDGRPRRGRPARRLPARRAAWRWRAVEHVRQPGPEARPRAEGVHARDGKLVQHAAHERGAAQQAARGREDAPRYARPRRERSTSCGRPSRNTSNAVHRILCIHLGTPPERFVWQWRDKRRRLPPHRGNDAAAVRRRVRRPAAR